MGVQKPKEAEDKRNEEMGEFHVLFRPFVRPIYRGALLLTASHRCAETVQTEIYLRAFLAYMQVGPIANFEDWLIEIVHDCFSNHGLCYVDSQKCTGFEAGLSSTCWLSEIQSTLNECVGHRLKWRVLNEEVAE